MWIMEKREEVADQLAAVLDKIAEMERREGFEGPKIVTSDLVACQRCDADPSGHCFEDGLVGEIWRACYELDLRLHISGRWWREEADVYMCHIVNLATAESYPAQESDSLALAAASAYRDALKETMK